MQLRDYQEEIVKQARRYMATYKRILIVSPTGSGKTSMAGYILGSAQSKGNSAYFCVHRRFLVQQVSKELTKQFIEHGYIVSGKEVSGHAIKIVMQQTYVRRNNPEVTLLIIDEAHLNCDTYQKILDNNPEAWVIFLSATPERLDGRAIPAEVAVEVIDTAECIERGYLVPYKYYAPTERDFSTTPSRAGDYEPEAVDEVMKRITGNAVEHYKKYGENGAFINFSYSVEHSKQTAEDFTAAGYPCVHLDYDSSDDEREDVFAKIESGELRGITNVNLFSEGADVTILRVCILQAPTQSMMRFRQRIGRVLRLHPSKPYGIVLDLVNDCRRHGLPDMKYEWRWRGFTRKKAGEEKTIQVRTCKQCFTCFPPTTRICPDCKFENPLTKQEIDKIEGELAEIKAEQLKFEKKKEIWAAKTLDDFIAIEKARGYKAGWGRVRYAIQQKKKASRVR